MMNKCEWIELTKVKEHINSLCKMNKDSTNKSKNELISQIINLLNIKVSNVFRKKKKNLITKEHSYQNI